jgi:putative DNA primase/helicase
MRRRIVMVPHLWKIPKKEQLPVAEVERLFQAELIGILNWAIQGWELFCEQGHKLVIPDSVKEATQEYIEAATTQPEYEEFLEESDEVEVDKGNANFIVGSEKLHKAYIRWRMRSGKKGSPLSNRALSGKLVDEGFQKVKEQGGRRYFVGIRLVEEETLFRSDVGEKFRSHTSDEVTRMRLPEQV